MNNIFMFFINLFKIIFLFINKFFNPIYKVSFYFIVGIISMCILAKDIIMYTLKGSVTPFMLIRNFSIVKAEVLAKKAFLIQQKELEQLELDKLKAESNNESEDLIKKQKEALEKMQQINLNNNNNNTKYVNQNFQHSHSKKLGEKINNSIVFLINIPKNFFKVTSGKKLSESNKDDYEFFKQKRERARMVIDFDSTDADKSPVKLLYKYEARDSEGRMVTDFFEAYSKAEVHSFLLSEGMEVYSIETNSKIRLLYSYQGITNVKIKTKDLTFFLTQLSTYIKSGIPLVDALRILVKQYKNPKHKKVFKSMVYSLIMGEKFSTALEKQGKAFPRLLINMVKASEMTGSLPDVLDDMADYYTETEKTKKAMTSALMYPIAILFIATIVVGFIMVFVVPQFVSIFKSMDAQKIPDITMMIMTLSENLQQFWWAYILGIVIFVYVFMFMYKNVDIFRGTVQLIMMRIPGFGPIIIYNEVTMFTKTFASLLEHNVFITDSMDILSKISNNEIYKGLINDTIVNLLKGDSISKAFNGHWAFPIPAYEMLVTGEKTGQLPEMMRKVADYYQDLHHNSVTRIKTFIEPVLIIFLTAIVGVIVLSIIVPMFSMYTTLQSTTPSS